MGSWKGAWGWVNSSRFGGVGELFAHQDDVMGHALKQGDKVQFTVGLDNKGRMRALEIGAAKGNVPAKGIKRKVEKDTTAFGEYLGAALEGEVVSFRPPWGWIRSETFSGGDIFAHVDDLLGGGVLTAGQ